jgi:hypothetical protein
MSVMTTRTDRARAGLRGAEERRGPAPSRISLAASSIPRAGLKPRSRNAGRAPFISSAVSESWVWTGHAAIWRCN